MTYRIKFRNHLRALNFLTTTLAGMLVLAWLLRFDLEQIIFMFLMYSIVFVPSLYLHIEYYLTNHNQQVEIKEDSVTLIVADRIVSTYQASDIQKVDLFKSAALDKGGIQIMPIDSYHFARIIPKAGNEIIVTCLIASDVEAAVKELKGVPIERKKKLFSSTKIG